jgi:spore cortex biosynthesis protein YabQ
MRSLAAKDKGGAEPQAAPQSQVCPSLLAHSLAWGGRPVQRLELQFHAFFMVVLSGVALGVLFDLLRTLRGYYRPNRWVGAAGDLLFWGAATLVIAGGLFLGNWGEFRFYVLVGLLLGLGLYYSLASRVISALMRGVLRLITWLLDLAWMLVLKLVWAPLVALATLLMGVGRILWGWVRALLEGVWQVLEVLGGWLMRPLRRPYRYARLQYLLAKRRVKRTLRRWLLGPPRNRRK